MEHTLNSNTRISKSLPKSYSKDDMCISSKEENKCKHLFKALKIQNGSLHLMQEWFKLLGALPRSYKPLVGQNLKPLSSFSSRRRGVRLESLLLEIVPRNSFSNAWIHQYIYHSFLHKSDHKQTQFSFSDLKHFIGLFGEHLGEWNTWIFWV